MLENWRTGQSGWQTVVLGRHRNSAIAECNGKTRQGCVCTVAVEREIIGKRRVETKLRDVLSLVGAGSGFNFQELVSYQSDRSRPSEITGRVKCTKLQGPQEMRRERSWMDEDARR